MVTSWSTTMVRLLLVWNDLNVGIPVKLFPEPDEEGKSEIDSVQYAALFADLVKKTQLTLSYLYSDPAGQQFQSLRLRTKQDTEFIVTDITKESNEYILVAIQNCKFSLEDEEEEGEAAEWTATMDWRINNKHKQPLTRAQRAG